MNSVIPNLPRLTSSNPNMDNDPNMSEDKKKKKERLEKVNYLKSHLDLIVVVLSIAYLTYSIVQIKRKIDK